MEGKVVNSKPSEYNLPVYNENKIGSDQVGLGQGSIQNAN